jgi:hypothetical protein
LCLKISLSSIISNISILYQLLTNFQPELKIRVSVVRLIRHFPVAHLRFAQVVSRFKKADQDTNLSSHERNLTRCPMSGQEIGRSFSLLLKKGGKY